MLEDCSTNPIKLSICIATYNRAKYIAETIESIAWQLTSETELIVVNGASPDDTEAVMEKMLVKFPEIKYYREKVNSGVDRDYNKAIEYATGDYCWFMSDDDLFHDDAVSCVLKKLNPKYDLIIANAESRTADLTTVLYNRNVNKNNDIEYGIADSVKLFEDMGYHLGYICSVIIKRNTWLQRDKQSYFGSLYAHIGVIFQPPELCNALFIAEPLIIFRHGNSMWLASSAFKAMENFQKLIWSFPNFPDNSKAIICQKEPWLNLKTLLLYRATGRFSSIEYKLYIKHRVNTVYSFFIYSIAILPKKLLNTILAVYLFFFNKKAKSGLYDLSKSKYSSYLTNFIWNKIR